MPYQRKLNVGDIVTIKASQKSYLVVRSEHIADDPGDGVPYRVDEIDVIPIGAERWLRMFEPGAQQPVSFVDEKVKSFYFEGGSMKGKGTRIKETDVKVLGTCKLRQEVHITYHVTKAKYYG